MKLEQKARNRLIASGCLLLLWTVSAPLDAEADDSGSAMCAIDYSQVQQPPGLNLDLAALEQVDKARKQLLNLNKPFALYFSNGSAQKTKSQMAQAIKAKDAMRDSENFERAELERFLDTISNPESFEKYKAALEKGWAAKDLSGKSMRKTLTDKFMKSLATRKSHVEFFRSQGTGSKSCQVPKRDHDTDSNLISGESGIDVTLAGKMKSQVYAIDSLNSGHFVPRASGSASVGGFGTFHSNEELIEPPGTQPAPPPQPVQKRQRGLAR